MSLETTRSPPEYKIKILSVSITFVCTEVCSDCPISSISELNFQKVDSDKSATVKDCQHLSGAPHFRLGVTLVSVNDRAVRRVCRAANKSQTFS